MLDANALSALKQLKSDIRETRELFTGTVKGSFSRFGFVICKEHDAEYFLSPPEMEKVLPGDVIEFERKEDDKGKQFAEVTRLISSSLKHFIAIYQVKGNAHLAAPEDMKLNRSFFIPPKERKGNKGEYIYCQVSKHPFPDGKAQARVLKVIGNKGTPYLEHIYAKKMFQVEDEFSLKASHQAEQYKESDISQLAASRTDFRDTAFVTIDNPGSRDMDDALWAAEADNGYHLRIAIADPAAWIPADSPLDLEASARATSTYFPGQTVSMLPGKLSTNLCSLVAGFDRLALIIDIQMNKHGELTDYKFESGVIKSRAKLNYAEVTEFIEQNNNPGWSQELTDSLRCLETIRALLNQSRLQNNLVMKDRDDFRFELDENGKILSIRREEKLIARQLVEECMLLANQLAAEFLAKHQTGLFSVQPGIRPDRQADILKLLAETAPELADTDLNQLDQFVQAWQQAEKLHPQTEHIMRKSLGRTELQSIPGAHFAQGFKGYTTITSPIRRYTDLLNHRCLSAIMAQKPLPELTQEKASTIQAQLMNSRQAANLTEAWLKCVYMENFEGVEFEAEVGFVNGIGFGVRIPENSVEGFVELKGAKPAPEFNSLYMMHEFQDAGVQVKLGDKVRVAMKGIDADRKQVQFKWLDQPV